MRIPPSAIVMAVVTAVPFGLAIRDEVKAPPANLEAERELAELRQLETRRERDLAEEQARVTELREARRAARDELLPGLFGEAPASLGPALGAVRLGAARDAVEQTSAALDRLIERTEIEATPRFEGDALISLALDLASTADGSDDPDRCARTATALTTGWGAPVTRGQVQVWREAATGQRLVLDARDGCVAAFERSVDAPAWIDTRPGAAVIPAWMLGKRADELEALVAPRWEPADGDRHPGEGLYAWAGPGLGLGAGTTELVARISSGKVAVIEATTTIVDAGAHDAVVAHLTARRGAPAAQADNSLRWAGAPVLRLLEDGDQLTLLVGEEPE